LGDKDVYNGDIGYIDDVNRSNSSGSLVFAFGTN
jgi:hypothetical protein